MAREIGAPASSAFVITPDDDADLPAITRGVYIGTGGDLVVHMSDGTEMTFIGVITGSLYPLEIKRVLEATTASDLVGVY